jgi:hypothetical protein
VVRKVKGLLFFLLALAAVAGGVYSVMTWVQAPPHFDGPDAELKALLWKFKNSDEFERMRAAVELRALHSARGVSGSGESLGPEDAEAEAQALQLATQIEDQVQLFESKLTQDDIEWITKDNPDSVIRVSGEFRSKPFECTEEEYRSIRDQVELPELQSRAMCVMTLNQAYEQPFLKRYRARRLELLERDPRFSESKRAGQAFYGFIEAHLENPQPSPAPIDAARIQDCESTLKRTGEEEGEVKQYLKHLVSIGPRCLVRVSPRFKEYLDKDVTITRGRFLIDKLRQYVQMTGKDDVTLQDLPLDRSDPLYGSTQDAWHHEFRLLREGSGFKLISQGPDSKEFEIKIGPTL